MKTIIIVFTAIFMMVPLVQADSYRRPYYFDLHGCKRHLKAIAKAIREEGGMVRKNDSNGRSYRMTLDGTTTIYTCTRNELLETEL